MPLDQSDKEHISLIVQNAVHNALREGMSNGFGAAVREVATKSAREEAKLHTLSCPQQERLGRLEGRVEVNMWKVVLFVAISSGIGGATARFITLLK